jgi:hypothetical protein
MNRSELNKAVKSYLNKGGKITKLPDGPNFRHQAYGVRVPNSTVVDTTAGQDPVNKQQLSYYEKSEI